MISIGGGSKSSTSKTVPVQQYAWSPYQQQLEKELIGPEGIIRKGLHEPVPRFPGQLHTPMLPIEEQFINYAANEAPVGLVPAAMGRPPWAANQQLLEDYYEKYVKAPMLREYQEVALPKLREAFAGPGYYGSRRMEEEARLAENLATKLAAEHANLYWTSLEAAANRAIPAAAVMANVYGTAGALARDVAHEKAMEDLTRWLSGETVEGFTPIQNNPFLQYAMGFMNLFPMRTAYETVSRSRGADFSFGFTFANLS